MMGINKMFNKPGFNQFLIKVVIFISLILLFSLSVNIYFWPSTLLPFIQFYQTKSLEFRHVSRIILFTLVAFIMFNRKKLYELKKYKFKGSSFMFLLIALFFFIYQYTIPLTNSLSILLKGIIFLLFVISLGFSVFGLDFIKDFIKLFYKQIFIFSLFAVAFFFILKLFEKLWLIMAVIVARIVQFLSGLVMLDTKFMIEKSGPILEVGNFKAIIGASCSGIDSLLLFTSLYIIIYLLDHKRLKKPLTIALFFIGAIGMFITNIIRVFLLFLVGAHISPKLAVGLFHTNVGWILFILYFFLFWWIASKFVYKKKTTLK